MTHHCAQCKEPLNEDDSYREFRYSYESVENPQVTNIGLLYICDDCYEDIADFIYEDEQFDEY